MSLKLSLIIPAYNEEKLIGENITRIINFLDKKPYSWEVVVVDDGSSDKTAKIVESLGNRKVRLITHRNNQGKGAALRTGFMAAKGDFQIFSDADLSVGPEMLDSFLQELEKFDVVIASRRVLGAEIKVHQPVFRENMGRVFTLLTKMIIGSKVSDFTCGFKGFKRSAAKNIFTRSLISRWAYDAEIIFLAEKLGYKIKEYPVSWTNRKETRVRLNRVVFESFVDLIKIRLFEFRGEYA